MSINAALRIWRCRTVKCYPPSSRQDHISSILPFTMTDLRCISAQGFDCALHHSHWLCFSDTFFFIFHSLSMRIYLHRNVHTSTVKPCPPARIPAYQILPSRCLPLSHIISVVAPQIALSRSSLCIIPKLLAFPILDL